MVGIVAVLAVIGALELVSVESAPASTLDGRGLELVTPEAPGPSIINATAISPDGEAIVYISGGPFPDAHAGDVVSYNRAGRTPEGWRGSPIGPAYELGEAVIGPTRPVAFDQGLAMSLWQSSLPLTPDGPPAGRFGFYRRAPGGSISLLAALGEEEPVAVGASRDANRLVFSSAEHLLPSDAARTEGSGIYELVGGALREVDVDAGGQELYPCGAEAGGPNVVSESGERIVFTAPASGCGQPRRVYVREGSETVEASASRCGRADCDGPQDVGFVGATPDGSSIFMVTTQQLTDEDEDAGSDLYRYDAGGDPTLLTAAVPGASGEVLAKPVHAGAAGSRVYFYARGRLLPGLGSPTATNLYLWQEGQLRFIAVLGAERPLQISGDGRYALLTTTAALSGEERERPLLFSFDGSDSTAGRFGAIIRIGIDEATGSVYVLDKGHDVVDKFTADGVAAPFAALGASSLSGASTPAGSFKLNEQADISVDNSGTASQGRIYVNAERAPVNAFAPNGDYLWRLPASSLGDDCGTAVDTLGHLWVADWQGKRLLEFAAAGSPPEQIGTVDSTTGNPCRLTFDRGGKLYLNIWNSRVDEYVGGAFAATLDPEVSQDVAMDQSAGGDLLFAVHEKRFSELTSANGLLGSSGEGIVENGVGIAYNPDRDWVYVADAGTRTIDVFGPPALRPAANMPVEGADQDGAADVYRYDAVANRFRLLSVGSVGGNGRLGATLRSPLEEPELFDPVVHFQALSRDGDSAWFATPERLLPEDQNDSEDVYEWSGGSLHLVSPGPGPAPAQFAGATPDGGTVLFRTARSLLPADRDGGDSDVYAARLGGGFPESQATPECPQQPCRREPVAATRFAAPVTAKDRRRGRGRLRIAHLGRDLVADILGSGSTPVAVHAPVAGLISARASTGGTLLGRGAAGATRAGRVSVPLAWNARARALLARRVKLEVRLRISEGSATATRELTLRGRREG